MIYTKLPCFKQFRFNVRRHSDAPKQNEHRLKEQTRVQALRVKETVRIGERSENDGNETAHLVDARQIIRVEFAAHIAKDNEHNQAEGLDVQHIRVLEGGYGLQQQTWLERGHLKQRFLRKPLRPWRHLRGPFPTRH